MSRVDRLVRDWRDQNLLLPIWMEGDTVRLLNQLKLPSQEEVLTITEPAQLESAIRDMVIRGSGAIGICGAYGMLLAAMRTGGDRAAVLEAGKGLKATRPTAVNLMKTVDELTALVEGYHGEDLTGFVMEAVCDILERQLDFERQLGRHGAQLIQDGDTVLTHCHSGALAGSGFGGRALSVIRCAAQQGKRIHVFSSETRPYLQGARITIWELEKLGIPHTMITDGMSGYLMRLGKIQKVVVGSDRVASNGDLLNKVGTYMHALAASENSVPFYTATSSHTIDFGLGAGMDIGVEFRDSGEVTQLFGQPITVPGTEALYPSFDVTPHNLIAGIITEQGVIKPPYRQNLSALRENGGTNLCQ